MLPCYFLVKLALYTWLQIPGEYMGARLIYQWIFKPIYAMCGKDLNDIVNRTHEQMYDFNKEVSSNLSKMKGQAADEALKIAMDRHA